MMFIMVIATCLGSFELPVCIFQQMGFDSFKTAIDCENKVEKICKTGTCRESIACIPARLEKR
jgi:hypothetical protein